MKIKAENFHPMKGHVEAGNMIEFPNGREFEIQTYRDGEWLLTSGETRVGPFDGAYALAAGVVNMAGMAEGRA